jgi:hypothetical protein
VATLSGMLTGGKASLRWAYVQAVGGPARERLVFEVAIGEKRGRSGILEIVQHAANTPQGAQERLRSLGYDPGPPLDEASRPFREALLKFQEAHPPLAASGELDEATALLLDEMAT